MSWIGLDIGGANLKLATTGRQALTVEFPLWRQPQRLPDALGQLLARAEGTHLALTMTGELADCYRTKAEGVDRILRAVEQAWSGPLRVYRTDGTWAAAAQARTEPLRVAAANWHALARLAARLSGNHTGLLLDIGSTTTDLIPWRDGVPCACGSTDPERLAAGELVYLGVKRTPVCAVADRLPWRGRWVPSAAEWFATTWDVYLLLGHLPPEPQAAGTADGRPATAQEAQFRLARQICADGRMVAPDQARQMAQYVHQRVLARLAEGWEQVLSRLGGEPPVVVVGGSGEFLARQLLARLDYRGRIVSLAEELGPALSTAATAYAVACLAQSDDEPC